MSLGFSSELLLRLVIGVSVLVWLIAGRLGFTVGENCGRFVNFLVGVLVGGFLAGFLGAFAFAATIEIISKSKTFEYIFARVFEILITEECDRYIKQS